MTHESTPISRLKKAEKGQITAAQAFRRCVACRWHTAVVEGRPQATYSNELSHCSGKAFGAFSIVLKGLVDQGAVTTTLENPDDAKKERRARRKYISPSTTPAGIAFQVSLEVPNSCNFEQPRKNDDTVATYREARTGRRAALGELLNASTSDELIWAIRHATELLTCREETST